MPRFPKIFIAILLLSAFLFRINQEIVNVDYNSDKAWQLHGTYNLINGQGITSISADIDDWSRATRKPLILWPPGYSLLLGLTNLVFKDLLISALAIEIFSLLIFFYALHAMAGLLAVDKRVYAIILAALSLPGHVIDRLFSTDLMALSIFQFALYLALYGLKSRRGRVFHTMLGIVIFMSGFLRYSYYPVLPAIPLAIVLAGLWCKERKVCVNGLIVGSTVFSCLAGLSVWQFFHAGQALYIQPTESQGLYPQNLLHFKNFIFSTFFNPNDSVFEILKDRGTHSLGIASVIVAFLLLVAVARHARPKLMATEEYCSAEYRYYGIAVLTILLNTASLSYLSLRHPGETDWTDFWTYVMEERYFAPSMLCLLWATSLAASAGMKTRRRFFNIPLLVMVVSLVFAAVQSGVKIYRHELPKMFRFPDNDLAKISGLIGELTKAAPEPVVMITSNDNAPMLTLFGCEIFFPDLYNDCISLDTIPTSRDIVVLMWTEIELSEEEKQFVQSHDAEKIAELDESLLYRIRACRQ